jgi:hypothetical protein
MSRAGLQKNVIEYILKHKEIEDLERQLIEIEKLLAERPG